MPKYVSDHLLQMGLITNLLGAKVACMGLGNAYMRPLCYVIIWIQVDRVQGYDEDQIALVIPDLSMDMDTSHSVWSHVLLLYNVLLLINHYTSNIRTSENFFTSCKHCIRF